MIFPPMMHVSSSLSHLIQFKYQMVVGDNPGVEFSLEVIRLPSVEDLPAQISGKSVSNAYLCGSSELVYPWAERLCQQGVTVFVVSYGTVTNSPFPLLLAQMGVTLVEAKRI